MGTFLLCWLPFFIVNVIRGYMPHLVPIIWFQSLTWLGYANSSANPVIYSIFNRDFRRAFKAILTRSCGCCTGPIHAAQDRLCGLRNRAELNHMAVGNDHDAPNADNCSRQPSACYDQASTLLPSSTHANKHNKDAGATMANNNNTAPPSSAMDTSVTPLLQEHRKHERDRSGFSDVDDGLNARTCPEAESQRKHDHTEMQRLSSHRPSVTEVDALLPNGSNKSITNVQPIAQSNGSLPNTGRKSHRRRPKSMRERWCSMALAPRAWRRHKGVDHTPILQSADVSSRRYDQDFELMHVPTSFVKRREVSPGRHFKTLHDASHDHFLLWSTFVNNQTKFPAHRARANTATGSGAMRRKRHVKSARNTPIKHCGTPNSALSFTSGAEFSCDRTPPPSPRHVVSSLEQRPREAIGRVRNGWMQFEENLDAHGGSGAVNGCTMVPRVDVPRRHRKSVSLERLGE